MNLHLVSVPNLFSFFFIWNLIFTSVNGCNNPAPFYIGDLAVNCGYNGNSTARDGRHWFGDTGTRSVIPMLQPRGKSRSLTADHRSRTADPLPYMTARVSANKFYYTFQVNPGQKFIRLHFYPSLYRGFEKYDDFFTVRAGAFTLLRNFSASLAADALGVKYLVKEFCLHVEGNKYFNITFSPSQITKQSSSYAFVNGIEIVSMPTGLYYTPDGDLGVPVVGQNTRYIVDNSTALEMIQRLNIGGSSISPVEDFGMFRWWSEDANYLLESKLEPVNHLVRGIKYTGIPVYTAPLKIYQTSWKTGKDTKGDRMHNFTWKIPVDVGFGYLVRLHFCDFELEMTVGGQRVFSVLINSQVAETFIDVIRLSGGTGVPIYRDYMVMVKGDKEKGKCDFLIALQSCHELVVGLLHGIEIFKLSSLDNNLASPNPVPLKDFSTSWNLRIQNWLFAIGKKNAIVTGMTVLITLLNIIVFKLRQSWEETFHQEKGTQATSSEQSCRCFELAEMISATRNFSDAFLIGKGGFGKVYKGSISGTSEIVAVKRLKSNSKQGAHEFWREIETLSKIRHINLVSLIGYCNDFQEMILVYEYMPRGTLADNLYKIGRNGKDGIPLTWEQRLRICIGAARGLDYLHTGVEYGVIHRDVKDSNILLDENLVAKVSDFGLSKLGNVRESQSCVSTKVKGTFGYLDPEYLMTHKPTTKTDVYAFGMVMLVVLCGKPAVDTRIPGEPHSLLSTFREGITKGDIDSIVDPSVQGKVSSESLKEFIKSIENCLHHLPRRRPTMSQVVVSLEYALELHLSAASFKTEESAIVVVGQPCEVGIIKTEINEFNVPPLLQENATSSPEEGLTNKYSHYAEQPSPQEDLLSRENDCTLIRRPAWVRPWEALRKIGNSLKKKDLFLEDGPASRFTISQIRAATGNFSSDRIIIDVPAWKMYLGITKQWKKKYAIYQLKANVYDKLFEEFRYELEILLQLRHKNLLSMIGYCYHKPWLFIVHEYAGNNTLHSCLYDSSHVPLSWIDRIRICIGIAEGLNYLHNGTVKTRIHGILRPESILFGCGQEWTPLLSTFGLSTLSHFSRFELASTYINMSFWEYLDAFILPPHLIEKYDVYSFGLVLLEVLCRRKPVYYNGSNSDERFLEFCVKRGIRTRRLHRIIDSNLFGQIEQTCLSEFLKIAFSCLHHEPTERPTMVCIVEALKFALQLQENGEDHDFENVYKELSDLAWMNHEFLPNENSGISQQTVESQQEEAETASING